MRFVIQQVSQATIDITTQTETIQRSIWTGAVVYVWIGTEDTDDYQSKIEKFVRKIQQVKLFTWSAGKIDASLLDNYGELLIVSNFTLYSRNKKGSGVDYTQSAPFALSKEIYDKLIELCHADNIPVITGEFWAMMNITATNQGPINHIREY